MAAKPTARPASPDQPGLPLWRDGLFWLALALTLFAVAPFLLPGYFWGANDARHHVYFLFEFDRVVQDGIWWPRWSPDFAFGYGYPFFNIYGPFSHFLAEGLLRFLGFSYTGAIEAVFVLSILGSAGAMYAFVRSWAGRQAGLLSALVYTYAPYHLLDLYVRANLAESMAFVWLPLCLWTFREAVRRPRLPWILAAGVSYAGLMLTSNLVIVLFTPLLALYVLALLWIHAPARALRSRSWPGRLGGWLVTGLGPLAGGLFGLGLSAVFWLPMLLERRYVRVDQWFAGRYDFRDDFLYFFQLFSPRWGFGVSQPGPDDPVGFQLGAAALALTVISVLWVWRARPRWRVELGVFVLAGTVTTLLTLHPLAPLWDWPVLGTILQFAQFPWRWLTVTTLVLGVLGGLILARGHECQLPEEVPEAGLSLPLLVLAALVILSSYPLLRVQIREPAEGPVSLAGLMRFQRDADELTGSTAWVKEIPTWSDMAEYYIRLDEAGQPVTPVTTNVDYGAIDPEKLVVGSVAHNTVMEEVFFCTNPDREAGACSPRDDQRIVFNRFYYPGWRAWLLDGMHGQPVEELPILPEEEGTLGRITVPVPPTGQGYILLRYQDTPPRIIGKWISWITLALAILLLAVRKIGLWRRSVVKE